MHIRANFIINLMHYTHTSFIDKLNRGRQSASRKWEPDALSIDYESIVYIRNISLIKIIYKT